MTIATGPVQDRKKEMFFSRGKDKKERKTNDTADIFMPTKQTQNLQAGGNKHNIVSNIIDNKCKCANEMCLSVFLTKL